MFNVKKKNEKKIRYLNEWTVQKLILLDGEMIGG